MNLFATLFLKCTTSAATSVDIATKTSNLIALNPLNISPMRVGGTPPSHLAEFKQVGVGKEQEKDGIHVRGRGTTCAFA